MGDDRRGNRRETGGNPWLANTAVTIVPAFERGPPRPVGLRPSLYTTTNPDCITEWIVGMDYGFTHPLHP